MGGDFLRTLAARTLGRSERLAPVAPARFEPAGDPVEFDVPEEPSRPPAPGPVAARRPPGDDKSPRPAERPAPFDVADRTTREPHDGHRLLPPGEHARHAPGPPADPPAQAAEATPEPALHGGARRHPTIRPRPAPAAARREPQPREDGELPVTLPLVPPAQTAPALPQGRRDAAEHARQQPSEPPTIVVRIGRVDVHAALAAKPQPAAAAPRQAARPSLADHLRARTEGRK